MSLLRQLYTFSNLYTSSVKEILQNPYFSRECELLQKLHEEQVAKKFFQTTFKKQIAPILYLSRFRQQDKH